MAFEFPYMFNFSFSTRRGIICIGVLVMLFRKTSHGTNGKVGGIWYNSMV